MVDPSVPGKPSASGEGSWIQPRTNMTKTIRVDEETHAALESLKGDDETFDDLLSRMAEARRETVRDGAGIWDDTDAAEKARETRSEMKRGVGDR